MSWKTATLVMILLTGALLMTGCTDSSPAPVTIPSPVSLPATVPASPAPVTTASLVPPEVSWPALETPATNHPYSKTYSFQGTGDYDELTFSTASDATWVITMTPPREGIFIVILKNSQGQDIETLSSEGISPTGLKSVYLKAGNYYFDIAADAPWYITMTTP
jgi:hypothetical protein